MDFEVGQKVIYPNHGIGVVESIQTRPTPTGKISLYKLRILSNDSRVWVPQQNADGVGLRHVISMRDVKKIFAMLRRSAVKFFGFRSPGRGLSPPLAYSTTRRSRIGAPGTC